MHDSVSRKRALTDLNLTAYERCRVLSNDGKLGLLIMQNFVLNFDLHMCQASTLFHYEQDLWNSAILSPRLCFALCPVRNV